MIKRRVTVTVDEHLVEAAAKGVEAGDAVSVSAWISEAIAGRVERDARRRALADVVAEYEAQHGEISYEEIAGQMQADRDEAARHRARHRAS